MSTSSIEARTLARSGIYNELRQQIVTGAIPPGTRLSDAYLQKQFPVSRKPIREAVNRLSGEGFIVVTDTRRRVVPTVTAEYVHQRREVLQALYIGSLIPNVAPFLQPIDERWFRLALNRFSDARSADDPVGAAAAFEDLLLPFTTRWGNDALLEQQEPVIQHIRRALIAYLTPQNARRLEAAASRAHAALLEQDTVSLEAALAEMLGDGIDAVIADIPAASEEADADDDASERLGEASDAGTTILLRDHAYDALLTAILDGTLQPGEILDDREVGAWLGVAKGTLREAYAKLSDVGLVEMVPKRFTRVRPLDFGDINRNLYVSGLLQRHAASTTVSDITDAQIAAVQQALRPVLEFTDPLDLQELSWAIRDYGIEVNRLTGNSYYVMISAGLDRRLTGFLAPRETLLDTKAIAAMLSKTAERIAARDGAGAAEAFDAIMQPTISNFVTTFRPSDAQIDEDVTSHVARYAPA